MIGKTVSHYKIISKLGEGGMGVVYKAEDTKLGRYVAIKFLPPQLSSDDTAKKRFIREAKTASALNHANIAVIHEIDETPDGRMFIVMAYYEGRTLKDRLESRALEVDEAIAIVSQIASGLAKAHEQRILHRDIKPANILLGDDGQATLTDFGLAMLAGQTKITKTGTTVGTVAYMSPEQASGGDVDHRSDIFSLGVVLYELVTGRTPFSGEHEAAVLYGIMHSDPEPLLSQNPDLPPSLQRIVNAALAKDRNARYQSVAEMLDDLADLSAGRSVSSYEKPRRFGAMRPAFVIAIVVVLAVIGGYLYLRQRDKRDVAERKLQTTSPVAEASAASIAVLPFVNLSANPDNEYFSDGLTEDLIYSLAKTHMRVLSRTSTFQFKGRAGDVRQIGATLGVTTVLEGTVRKSGQDLLITASLVNVSDGYQLWSGRFERQTSDVFAIQNEISREIVNELEIELAPEQETDLYKRYTENLEAYNAYLKGRYYWNVRSTNALRKAIALFEDAIALDAGYALAYAGLADAYLMAANYGATPPEEAYQSARAAAMRAIALDERLAEPHASMGLLEWIVNWDWEAAEREFERAVSLRSAYATTYHWHALFLTFLGRIEDAKVEIYRALALDPVSPIINSAVALVLYTAEDYDAAIDQVQKTLDMRPDFFPAYTVMARAYAEKGMYEESIRSMQRSMDVSGRRPNAVAWLGYIYARSGRVEEARRLLKELESKAEDVSDFEWALIHAAVGELPDAFRWMEKTYRQRSFEISTCQTDPMLEELRNDPEYAATLKRAGFPVP